MRDIRMLSPVNLKSLPYLFTRYGHASCPPLARNTGCCFTISVQIGQGSSLRFGHTRLNGSCPAARQASQRRSRSASVSAACWSATVLSPGLACVLTNGGLRFVDHAVSPSTEAGGAGHSQRTPRTWIAVSEQHTSGRSIGATVPTTA